MMAGDATEAQIGAFLLALRTKGETVEEIEGLARTMLAFAIPVQAPEPVIDTCGTGGDRAGTFNISTIAALVVAGAGVPVAKHGNRAASSHCGSADLLEELGVRIDLDAAGVERCLDEAGIGFMFAAHLPPGDGARGAGPRASCASRPCSTSSGRSRTRLGRTRRWSGVSDERMLPLMAEVLARRGTRAKLFRGVDGLDELTTTDLSTVYDVKDGTVRETHLDPRSSGSARSSPRISRAATPRTTPTSPGGSSTARQGATRDVVLLNAGAALEVAGFRREPRGGHGDRRARDRRRRRRQDAHPVGRGLATPG